MIGIFTRREFPTANPPPFALVAGATSGLFLLAGIAGEIAPDGHGPWILNDHLTSFAFDEGVIYAAISGLICLALAWLPGGRTHLNPRQRIIMRILYAVALVPVLLAFGFVLFFTAVCSAGGCTH